MKKTGDIVIDTVLKKFREAARPAVQSGRSVNIDDCLERAIFAARTDLRHEHVSEREIRQRIWPEEESIRETCRKIVFEMEKRGSLMDIRKTSIEAVLEDFAVRNGLDMTYKLRDNSTVGFCVKIQPMQFLRFSASFLKVLSQEWMDKTGQDLKEFLAISSRLGRIRISGHDR